MDFDIGETVHLTGVAEVGWNEDEELPFEDVERIFWVTLKKGTLMWNGKL